MYLSKIKYQKENESKIFIVLILGRKNNKLVCIIDDYISQNDTKLIKLNSGKLNNYTISNKINWFKNNLPHLYKKGYREIFLNKVTLLKSFPIK